MVTKERRLVNSKSREKKATKCSLMCRETKEIRVRKGTWGTRGTKVNR